MRRVETLEHDDGPGLDAHVPILPRFSQERAKADKGLTFTGLEGRCRQPINDGRLVAGVADFDLARIGRFAPPGG